MALQTGATGGDKNALASPYYLHPSDNTGQVLTPILLNGANYERWAKLMLNSLKSKRKIGFVDGTLTRPVNKPEEEEKWDMVIAMIIGWIYSSVESKLRPSISLVDSAKIMWGSLQRRFSMTDDTRIHQLHSEIASCKQNGDAVEVYFGKLKVMWDDLADFDKGFSCCCGNPECEAVMKYEKKEEKIRVHQFLMGLDNSRFGTTRSNLLSRQAELNLESVYSQIIQEERHLNVMRHEDKSPAIGLSAVTQPTSLQQSQQIITNAQAAAARFARNNSVCSHCGKQGHEVNQCFQVIGYPEWWGENNAKPGAGRGTDKGGRGRGGDSQRGRGRGGRGSGFRAYNTQADTTSEAQGQGFPNFTPEQWATLTQFVNSQKSTTSEKLGKKDKLVFFGKDSRYDIIIDSGASHHMTGEINLLSDVVTIAPVPITMPNGSITWATRQGQLNLGGRLILRRVFYAPHLSATLISISQLLQDIAGFILFTKKFCVIQDLASKTLIGAGEEHNGVFKYMGTVSVQANHVEAFQTRDLWHARMGHPSSAVLSVLSSSAGFTKNIGVLESSCGTCHRAKQTRDVFPVSINKVDECFALIHCDLWGPYHEPSTTGARYFLTIVDDFSRAVWTILLLEKKEAPQAFKTFCAYVDRQFNKKIKMVRSDNGSEFITLKGYFASQGILHQTSCVETPQQNARVERKHRHILNVARALLFQGHVPRRFWGESILTATYLINRTPSRLLHNKTPYEMLYGKAPSYDNLRVFGTLCYARRIKRGQDKFDERSTRCVFLGYPMGKKGWTVCDLETERIFDSRDVIFHEEIFPFALTNSMSETIEHVPVPTPHPATYDDDFDPVSPTVVSETGGALNSPQTSTSEPSVTNKTSQTTEPAVGDNDQGGASNTEETTTNEQSTSEPLGRGHRTKTQSVRLGPYVTYTAQVNENPATAPHPSHPPSSSSGKCAYPLENYVSFDRLAPHVQAFLLKVEAQLEPTSFKEAMKDKKWRNAATGEIDALERSGTWTVTDLPPGKQAIGCKWIFKIKFNADGTVERYKARLVACGNKQEEGVDYNETFAPVVKMNTVRTLLGISAARDWELHQMDVHNAFLHGELEEEVYMKLPPGFASSKPNQVCKLNKALYGLKQAPRCWFARLTKALLAFGFKQNRLDYSLFTLNRNNTTLFVLVYVDDLIIGGNNSELITKFKEHLHRSFHMKDLGELRYFLGIEVLRSKAGIYLSQRKYALDIVSECGLLGSKPVDTPMEQYHNLGRDNGPFYTEPAQYRRLVGRLVYLAITRPELNYPVHILAQFLQKPRQKHWDAAVRLVRYLKGLPGQGILLSASSDLSLSAYSDSDWAACPLTRKSLTGYIVMMGNSLVSWKTKKQPTVSRSSAEAEYRAMAMTCSELKWMIGVMDSLGIKQRFPIPFHCDSKAAIHIATNPVFHERTKHVEVDCHFVRDYITAGIIAAHHVGTMEQLADLLTKSLGRQQLHYLLDKMGVQDLHSPP